MGRKVLAVTVISIGAIAFLVSWDKFMELFNVIGQPPESGRETYFAIIGQSLFYFILSSTILLFGLLFLLRIEGQKFRIIRMTFFSMATIWFVLETPIYKCDFYEINHSFWESKRGHFH
jgi:flagellar biosynthesis protein FlhB